MDDDQLDVVIEYYKHNRHYHSQRTRINRHHVQRVIDNRSQTGLIHLAQCVYHGDDEWNGVRLVRLDTQERLEGQR